MDSIGNIKDEKLMDDLWLISRDDKTLAFAPLRGKVFLVKSKGVEALRSFSRGISNKRVSEFLIKNDLTESPQVPLARIGKPYQPVSIVLPLTSACNLKCIYCYASAEPNTTIMSDDIAKSAIDIAINQAKRNGKKEFRVLFHGGGESLVAWSLLKQLTEYVANVWEGTTRFSIVTNGTLITPKRADWFKQYDFHFTISLDGPEDIQNEQRPMANGKGSFEACYNGAKLISERGISCGIRATITGKNVRRMNELVRIANELNCGLKVAPFTPTGRGKTGIDYVNPVEFVNSFQRAEFLANELNVRFQSTYSPNLEPRTRYCAADGEMFLVLPNGEVSACSRVTKLDDDLSDIFIIGQVNNDQLDVDSRMVDRLRHLHVQEFSQCVGCFAKWHCAGGCHHARLSLGGNMSTDYCDLSRWFLWSQLLHQTNTNDKGGDKYG